MKLQYAYGKNKNLIDISDAQKVKGIKYHCVNCEGELRPRKGPIRVHHYAHKPDSNCSYETYLHKLAKLKFKEQYSNCLETKKPFKFEYNSPKRCISCSDKKPISKSCLLGVVLKEYDLTERFDIIEEEVYYKGYKPDIILKSSKTDDVIFIEFVVTHFCTQDKIKSGIRIIEVKLESELDLVFLQANIISTRLSNIELYNFKIKEEKDLFRQYEVCGKRFDLFIVDKLGSPKIISENLYRANQEVIEQEYTYYKVLCNYELHPLEARVIHPYTWLIKDAARKGAFIRSCHACTHNINKNNKENMQIRCHHPPNDFPKLLTALNCADFSLKNKNL